MAKTICGEASLKVGARTVRLRLDIGTMMDLEDHLGMGLVPFLAERFQEFRIKDVAAFYAAMTGTDFTSDAALTRYGIMVWCAHSLIYNNDGYSAVNLRGRIRLLVKSVILGGAPFMEEILGFS
jgi:hypothetical protein